MMSQTTATLYLLSAPWGAGKTPPVPHLARLLPEVVVFDWDLLLPGLCAASGKDAHTDASTWDGLKTMWVDILAAVLAGGRDVLLCGPLGPADVAGTSVAPYPRRGAYLDLADVVLAARLRARGETEAALAEELAMMTALRASGSERISARDLAPPLLAEAVAAWVLRDTRTDLRTQGL